MPIRAVAHKQSETAGAPMGRRHYTEFNKQSRIPDVNERPFATQPTLRANMRVNEESTNHYSPRPGVKIDVPHPTPKPEPKPRQCTRVNNATAGAVIDGTSPPPTHRRQSRAVGYEPREIQQRPVKAFGNHTTTLDADLQ